MTNFTVGSNLSTTSAIVIDTTAPVISNVSPASSSTVLNKEIGYTLSEQCASGTVVFTRTGGSSTDSGSPHTVNLVSSELTIGVHAPAVLYNNPTLVNGSVYSIAFNATDLAGNTATTVTNTSITYNPDSVAPTLVITSNDVNSGDLSNLETIVLIFTISETTTNFIIGAQYKTNCVGKFHFYKKIKYYVSFRLIFYQLIFSILRITTPEII